MAPDEPPSNVIPFPSHRRGGAQPALPLDDGEAERDVTLLLTALHGWAQVTAAVGTAQARVGLARATSAALEALGRAGATSIVVDGDPTEPAISGEFDGPESTIEALRAAVAVRHAVSTAQSPAPPEHQFRVGTGLDRGTVVTVRAGDELTFDAIGPMRMVAGKLRDFAGPGQVFMSRRVYEAAGGEVQVRPLGDMRINIHGETEEAFSLTDLAGAPPD